MVKMLIIGRSLLQFNGCELALIWDRDIKKIIKAT